MERRFSLLKHDHPQIITTADGASVRGTVARYWAGNWTPSLRGDGTAGTYETVTAEGRWTRVGDLVTLSANLTLASSITGGGTGNLVIATLPFAPNNSTGSAGRWWGTLFVSGVDIPGVFCGAQIHPISSSTYIYLYAMTDNAAYSSLVPSGLAANDFMQLSISYEAEPIT